LEGVVFRGFYGPHSPQETKPPNPSEYLSLRSKKEGKAATPEEVEALHEVQSLEKGKQLRMPGAGRIEASTGRRGKGSVTSHLR